MARIGRFEVGSGAAGATACLASLTLLALPSRLASAGGVELLALAFWLWARTAEDAREQVPRWEWLRRPAMALAVPRFAWLAVFEAACVVWAGLELVAALPLARRYSDFPGPYKPMRPWIPVVLPCAGFLVLWSGEAVWRTIAIVRDIALVLLVFTAVLGALRAFARRGWTASLRWLAVCHTSLALIPLAGRVIETRALLLLWIAAFGGPAFVLAGELSGASTRRGPLNARLWRTAGWVSTTALSWVALSVFTSGRHGVLPVLGYLGAAIAVVISTWIMVGRLEVAPERRRLMRPSAGLAAGRLAALLVIALGPAGLLRAWWHGFEPHFTSSLLALAPAVVGGLVASSPRQRPLARMVPGIERAVSVFRGIAGLCYRLAVRIERGALASISAVVRTIATPLRDLHTGDAQEYLLLLVGVSVLVLLLPLLR